MTQMLWSAFGCFFPVGQAAPNKQKLTQRRLYLAILCDLFAMVKLPFHRLSDLQPGDEKVTLNHLVYDFN